MTSALEKEILQQVSQLTQTNQQRVLDYARSLAAQPAGTSGHQLLRFGGTIEAGDLDLMSEAIEQDCEMVDPDKF